MKKMVEQFCGEDLKIWKKKKGVERVTKKLIILITLVV